MNAALEINRYSVTNTKVTNLYKESDFEVDNASAALAKVIALPSPRLDRKTIFIQDLGDARVSLREPLAVSIETWPDHVTAYSYDTSEFSFSDDEIDAVEDFKASVVDLYFLLREEQDNLGPLPLKHWNFLKSVIQEH